MKKIEIEDRTKRFSITIIRLVEKLPRTTAGFVIGKQLLRSATSIGANLIEGRGGVSKKDFINFLSIARKSAIETDYWLKLLGDSEILENDLIYNIRNELEEITKVISAIILKTKQNYKK